MLRLPFAVASRGRLSILIFHRVLEKRDPLLPGEPTAAEFDALLAHLKRRFNVLPLDQAVARLAAGTLPGAALAITFDDGYADNALVAGPLLKKHALPATLFIATGYLDGGIMWNDMVIAALRTTACETLDLDSLGLGSHALDSVDRRRCAIDAILGALKYEPHAERERKARSILEVAGTVLPVDLMLTSAMVLSLASHGIDVGAHTITHPILARTPDAEAWQEIRGSKERLEALVRRPVTLFAYPNGHPGDDYGNEHVRMVREAGFAGAVSTAWGAASRRSDTLQLPRFTPWSRTSLKFDWLMLRNLAQGMEQRAVACG